MDPDLTPVEYYFDNSLFGWAIKDCNSQYVYGNKMVCQYFGVTENKLLGRLDTDLTPDVSEHYDHILYDDQKILTTNEMSIVLKTFDYGRRNRLRSFLVEKRPWRLNDGNDGIICTYIEITNVYFSTFLMPCERKSFVFTRPANIFTDKEWEVILLLQCGVKQNSIPDILGISSSTLRNRITRCCDKTGVANSTTLIQHCNQKGWDNYIPPFFLIKGHVSIT
ncbi:PAS domain-containing protein [Pectobacterium versatile]|uniref:PAS domain-containing protein n=1 Tax=Pectobacterium versatile TaxID=2488639 RepID=UPI0015DEEEC5|nr:PAS domain-containing protein [Pectobacterium versatile]MBA0173677.1 PAS domain-containing protein [Pectobacterium versatile]MBN3062067.1 PAS domain-containing protein [Pectobacterium versatile]MBQ4789852.1 PAS domain-containing protein [Pectobacterium versatile]